MNLTMKLSAPLLLLLILPVLPLATLAADSAEAAVDDSKGLFGLGWLDQTRAYSTSKADALALQLDRYFGVERSDLEAPYSSLRLTTELDYKQGDGVDPHVRLRGTLHLPRVDERVRLIFSEDQGEGASYYKQNELLNPQQSTRVNVELKLKETDHHRFDFRVGLRSSLKLRASVRYRYENEISESLQHRFSQTVYFIDGTGYGAFSQYQLDKALDDSTLLRWSNELRAEENLNGREWATSLTHATRFSNASAVSYFARMGGTTAQDYVGVYQVGIRMRRNIARPWLFVEFSPGYSWEKADATSPRKGGVFASIRLEMAIGI